MALIAAAVGGLFFFREAPSEAAWAAGLTAWLLGCAWGWQTPLRPFYHAWMLLARVLGFVNSHLLLALVFYTLFTAIGLAMRLLRYDPLERRRFAAGKSGSGDGTSYWSRRAESQLPAKHFERQF